jgi:uncharacterized protein YbjT (DUF2867 family)
VVRLSAIGAAHDAPDRSGRLHALSDRETEQCGSRWTILRPYWFMQNLLNEAGDIAVTGAALCADKRNADGSFSYRALRGDPT